MISDTFDTSDIPLENQRLYFKDKKYFYVESATYFINQGSFGRVYNCYETQIYNPNMKFCVKIMEGRQNINTKQDYQNEFIIIKKLIEQNEQYSENLVKIIDIVQECIDVNLKIYIVMEKCDGDLGDLIKSHQDKTTWFNKSEQIDLFNQILRGYKFLYDNKIVHRDLKPQNILYKRRDTQMIYKITDFGFAKIVDDVCQTNMITKVGTYNYLSPQILTQAKYTYKTDLYSLGIVFHRIIYNGLNPQQKQNIDNLQFIKQLNETKVFQPYQNQTFYEQQVEQLLKSTITYYEHDRISLEDLMKLPILSKKFQNSNIRFLKLTQYDPIQEYDSLKQYIELYLQYCLAKFNIISEFTVNLYIHQNFINENLFITKFHLQMIITCLVALSQIQLDYALGFINQRIELIPEEFRINSNNKDKFFQIINQFRNEQSEQQQKFVNLHKRIKEVEQKSQMEHQLKEQKYNALIFIQNNMSKKADQKNILNEIRGQFRILLEKEININQTAEYFNWLYFFYYKLWPQAESNQLTMEKYQIYQKYLIDYKQD